MAQHDKGDTELFSVYVPTNHVYVGAIFLLGKADIIKTNLSVREGLGASLQLLLARLLACMLAARSASSQLPLRRMLTLAVLTAEIVVSVGMGLPRTLKALRSPHD